MKLDKAVILSSSVKKVFSNIKTLRKTPVPEFLFLMKEHARERPPTTYWKKRLMSLV